MKLDIDLSFEFEEWDNLQTEEYGGNQAKVMDIWLSRNVKSNHAWAKWLFLK